MQLSALQTDALGEVINIGACRAVTRLSILLKYDLSISLPVINGLNAD